MTRTLTLALTLAASLATACAMRPAQGAPRPASARPQASQDAPARPDGSKPFNGLITDQSGVAVKGARVYTHSADRYARTNGKGQFGLTDVAATDTLHITYRRQRYDIPVEGRRSIRIRLADQLNYMAEEDQQLVDLGYGYVKRREHTGVSTGISGEELRRTGEVHLLQALRGRVPGLNVSPGARPGDEGDVTMRGTNSFFASQRPLFIVDGVEVNSLDMVPIGDVDYVEVLKDASIYGSRGANGAILVHTLRGPAPRR